METVSVVMPSYKRIDQTIISLELLLASKGIGEEFSLEIIVADGTPDESLKDAVSAKFGDSVRYVKPERTGIAHSKNAGANAATGRILMFSDSDMEVEPDTIRNAVHSLTTHETAAMVGGIVKWKGGPHDGANDRPREEDRREKRGETTYIEALYSRFIATYRSVFNAVGGYDTYVFNMRGEGSDLSIRYWRAGFPLTFDESVVVHHVHDVPDAAAVRVNHSEWGVAKDLLLLAYKYDMLDGDYNNFAKTVRNDFAPVAEEAPYRMLQGIGKHLAMITDAKPKLDAFRATDKPAYDFKFLEVFSDKGMFDACISSSSTRVQTR